MEHYLIKLPKEFEAKKAMSTRGINPLENFIEHFAQAANCPKANIKSNIFYEVHNKGEEVDYFLCGELSKECYEEILNRGLMSPGSLISKQRYKEKIEEINKKAAEDITKSDQQIFMIQYQGDKIKVKKIAPTTSASQGECKIL